MQEIQQICRVGWVGRAVPCGQQDRALLVGQGGKPAPGLAPAGGAGITGSLLAFRPPDGTGLHDLILAGLFLRDLFGEEGQGLAFEALLAAQRSALAAGIGEWVAGIPDKAHVCLPRWAGRNRAPRLGHSIPSGRQASIRAACASVTPWALRVASSPNRASSFAAFSAFFSLAKAVAVG